MIGRLNLMINSSLVSMFLNVGCSYSGYIHRNVNLCFQELNKKIEKLKDFNENFEMLYIIVASCCRTLRVPRSDKNIFVFLLQFAILELPQTKK